MRVVPSSHVTLPPQRCAVVPTIGPVSQHRFIDTGQDLYANSVNTPQRIYISEPAVGEMARMLGWTAPAEAHATASRVEALVAELEQARAERDALERQLAAVQVLKNGGFQQTRPPGRPKKAVA